MNYDGESEKLPKVHYSPLELDEDDLQSEEKESNESERALSYIEAANPTVTEGLNHWSVFSTRSVSSTRSVFSTRSVSTTRSVSATRSVPSAQSDNTQRSTPSLQSQKEFVKNIPID